MTNKAKNHNKKATHHKITTVFMNGQSQAVRIPKEYRLSGEKVYIVKSGNCLMLVPVNNTWELFSEALNTFTSDFMKEGRNQPLPQKRKDIFK